MGNIAEKEILNILNEYAFLLNSAQYNSIAAFYTEDGQFMPEGFKTISRGDFLKNRSGNFLKSTDFKIDYTIENTFVNNNYAFVSAVASTSTRDFSTGEISVKTSRDFFVLRRDDDNWKIYRYMFNKF